MFKFSLKYLTAAFAKDSQKDAGFFSALCVIFAPFAVKKRSVFLPEKYANLFLFIIIRNITQPPKRGIGVTDLTGLQNLSGLVWSYPLQVPERETRFGLSQWRGKIMDNRIIFHS